MTAYVYIYNVLVFPQITRIEGLDKLSNLKKLDLSYNKIELIGNSCFLIILSE
jgi:Leucine-rich repeat (LRR) protein